MGKHSKRKAGYLPKVAAGAAPFALLLAAPASSWASDLTQPLEALPLGHQHDGRFDRGLELGNDGDASVVKGFLTTYDHDVYSPQVGDMKVISDFRRALSGSAEGRDELGSASSGKDTQAVAQAVNETVRAGDLATATTGTEQHLDRTSGRSATLSADPLGATIQGNRRLGVSDWGRHGVRLPQNVGLVSENAEQVDAGLVRSLQVPSAGRFAGDLGAHRSAGQAIDAGRTAALGMTSEQHGLGRFSGKLDGVPSALTGADVGQSHAFGGHVGPVWGLMNTGQSAKLGEQVTGTPTVGAGGELADSFSGDLGVDQLVHVRGAARTSAAGAGGVPTQPSGTVSHEHAVSVSVLGQPPVAGGLKLSAPPLSIEPR